jgi:hypothetical protein
MLQMTLLKSGTTCIKNILHVIGHFRQCNHSLTLMDFYWYMYTMYMYQIQIQLEHQQEIKDSFLCMTKQEFILTGQDL